MKLFLCTFADLLTTHCRASLRLEDSYLHVPGFHPSNDSPAVFQQRVDNPKVLPSLHKHLWGRPVALGSLILKAEKDIHFQMGKTDLAKPELKFSNDPLRVTGEGSGFVLEWSEPTVVTIVKSLTHLRRQYWSAPSGGAKLPGADSDRGKELPENRGTLADVMVFPVEVEVQITDLNTFIYGLSPGIFIYGVQYCVLSY